MRFAALFFVLSVCLGQTCQPFAGEPELCRGLVGYSVWVPPGLTQAGLSSALLSSGVIASALLPGECARAAARSACSQTFRACGDDGLPLPLCLDYCQQYAPICGAQIFNCSAPDLVFAPLGLWQQETNRTGVPQQCVIANQTNRDVSCPLPFITNPLLDQCSIKCPPTGLDDSHINGLTKKFAIIGGSLSVVVSAFLLPYLAWCNFGVERSNMFEMWLSIFISSVGDVVPKWQTDKEIMCEDDWTLRRRDSSSCLFTSFTGYWARQAVTYWGMINMYRVAKKLFQLDWTGALERREIFWWLDEQLVFKLVGWGMPTLQYIIALSKDWISSGSGIYSCSVNTVVYNGWVNNALALFPLTFVVSITTFFIIAIVWKITKYGWRIIKAHWNTVAMCTIYAMVVWYIIIFAWHIYDVRETVTSRITTYIGCAVSAPDPSVCVYRSALNEPWQLSVIFLTSFYPLLLFITFVPRGPMDFYSEVIKTGAFPKLSSELQSVHTSGSVSQRGDAL